MKRQHIRKLILFVSFLLFPVTMWYFSPAIIIMGMAQHILNGSFFVFLLMLLLSTFMGRSFCSYLCPAGGLQDISTNINDKPAKQGKRRVIKYVIWVIWIAAIIISFALGNGAVRADVFFMTDHGVSVVELHNYVVYYAVILLLFLPSLLHGKRAACHYICWMAPFMILGEKIGQKLHIPQIHVTAENVKCISCKKCESVCPMGLNVMQMVKENNHCQCTDCIQCGACVDSCPNNVLSYSWKTEKDN
ncbi:4Fe-4S binding protein [Lachnospiraceae bacterium MD1]|jgi:polyferredoxin|uniref:4Fe-4S binding protein n=1 Tax=Variimorphobacter saccharofermentans TaxID=2755051 RepID=A0A839K0L1_9FIRM|nr:4Fe-4S dicluster domain-containing protein [Variimorphobacter saccharofermentans]MBB2183463.1 4Fe-4S binding protein [Variimorphobacter saccharofermentans]